MPETYDKNPRTKSKYDGEPVLHRDGIAGWDAEYDERGKDRQDRCTAVYRRIEDHSRHDAGKIEIDHVVQRQTEGAEDKQEPLLPFEYGSRVFLFRAEGQHGADHRRSNGKADRRANG